MREAWFLLLCAVGMTLIMARSTLFEPVRKIWPKFLGCPQCVGFWVGAAIGSSAFHVAAVDRAMDAVLFGCATSVASLFVYLAISWLDEH